MPEERQEPKTLEELSKSFERIDGLSGRIRQYNDAVKQNTDPRILGSLETDLAQFVLGGAGREINHVDYQNELRQYRNPQSVNIRINESMQTAAKQISSDYKARLDEIINAVVAKLNNDVKDAESKSEAYENIEYALRRALREINPAFDQLLGSMNQEQANGSAADRLKRLSGARTTFVDPTSNSGYESDLRYRLAADQFGIVKEEKEGEGENEKVKYSINRDAVKKLVENSMIAGAILYSAEKPEREKAEYAQAA